MQKLTELIVKLALADIGNKEKPNNSGWYNQVKEKAMRLAGWIRGEAWCAYNSEVLWVNGFTIEDPSAVKLLVKYFSGSAVQTFKNFKASKEFKTSTTTPWIASLAVWQSYKNNLPQITGHIGIVVEWPEENIFKSVEGNTSELGSREGTTVGKNTHDIRKEMGRTNGLRLIGFVSCIRLK